MVERHVDSEVGPGDVLDHDIVGAGHEHLAAPTVALGADDSGGEVGCAPVRTPLGRRAAQPHPERGMEGLHPQQRPPVGELLPRREVTGQQPVLYLRQLVGERGRAGFGAAVRADQGVVVDDDPVVVRIAEHHGAVAPVAAQEGVLPAGGGGRLPGALHGLAHGVASSTATPNRPSSRPPATSSPVRRSR